MHMFRLLSSVDSEPKGSVSSLLKCSSFVAGNDLLPWTVNASGISKHGMANGGYRGSSREWTFTVTPPTTYTVNGAKGSFSGIQKGAHVNVQHTGLVATHVDVVP
jgi:hypothetical protein